MEQVTAPASRELDLFFRSFGVRSEAELARLHETVLAHQREGETLRACAERCVRVWLGRVLAEPSSHTEGGLLHAGRAALLLCGAGAVPGVLLSETLDAEWVARIRRALPSGTPAPVWGQMPEQSLSPAPVLMAVRRYLVLVEPERGDGAMG